MSKNIFDEALESFTDIETDVVDVLEMQNYDWWVIKRSLELGKLYKQLNKLYQELYTMELSELSLNSNYYKIELIKLKQRIKELENEKINSVYTK